MNFTEVFSIHKLFSSHGWAKCGHLETDSYIYLSLLTNTNVIQQSIQMSKRDEMIDRLKAETTYLKDQQRDKEREV